MRHMQNRLKKMERNGLKDNENESIRKIVRSLTLDEACFCLWVIRDGEAYNQTDYPKPTKEDEKRAAMLLKHPLRIV